METTTHLTGFQTLPLELRLQVYHHLLIQNDTVYVNKNWSEPADLIATISALLEIDREEILRVYYQHNTFGYLLTNLKTEVGTYDYQGLLHALENLGPRKCKWLRRIEIVCFFSTPERVAVGKKGISDWLAEKDRGMEMDVFHFTERYWCCQPQ